MSDDHIQSKNRKEPQKGNPMGPKWPTSTTILEIQNAIPISITPTNCTQVMERALTETHLTQRRWVTKQITGQFTHRKNMM